MDIDISLQNLLESLCLEPKQATNKVSAWSDHSELPKRVGGDKTTDLAVSMEYSDTQGML